MNAFGVDAAAAEAQGVRPQCTKRFLVSGVNLRRALAFPFLILAVACGPPGGHGAEARIARAVAAGEGTVVDLARLAPFPWTRLYVFGPYTEKVRAEQALGMRWPYRWETIDNKGQAFVVFVDSGKVVATFDQLNEHGIVADTAGHPHGYPRDSARFVVRDLGKLSDGKTPYRELRWLP